MQVETDEFIEGQVAQFALSFTYQGQPVSPTLIVMTALRPDGVVDTISTAGSADTRAASYAPSLPGWHVWRVEASGANGYQDAEEGQFLVHPRRVPVP